MNIEDIRTFCLSKKGVTESFPFDETTLVFKVGSKMFALMNIEGDTKIAVKCKPELAIELREKHDFIKGAYHMNKKHWNSIEINFAEDMFIKQQINNSYNLIFSSLPKNKKNEINAE